MKKRREFISPGYEALQRELHMRPEGYGGKGFKWADAVLALIRQYGAGSVLDYGCGRGSLARKLADLNLPWLRIAEYDPAVDGKNALPDFADLVTVTDVLEHVEPEKLVAVLSHLHLLARRAVFFVVALEPANKILSDGRNAHLILETREWWIDQVTRAGFRLSGVEGLPFHRKYRPDVQQEKRWMSIGEPC